MAIVSEQAGTTRDVIEVRLDLGGYAVTLADTAGLREAAGAVEAEGVRRALARAEAADLVLLVLDGNADDPGQGVSVEVSDRAAVMIWNKKDLSFPVVREGLAVSAKTGEGIPELVELLTGLVREKLENRTGSPPLTRAHHRHALEQAVSALERAPGLQRARTHGRGPAPGAPGTRAHHWPGGRRGSFRRGFPRFLHLGNDRY